MASFMLRGRIPLETSILSGRLNIVQTDRQRGIIPPLPSPPTLPSKPSGSHFSVTTEEEDQRGKGAPLCSSLITLWPWDHPSATPLQVFLHLLLLLVSLFFGETVERDEEWRSESGRSSPLYLLKTGECQGAGALESAFLSVSRGELGWVHLE